MLERGSSKTIVEKVLPQYWIITNQSLIFHSGKMPQLVLTYQVQGFLDEIDCIDQFSLTSGLVVMEHIEK